MTTDITDDEARARRLRNYALITTARLLGAGLVLFLILRVFAPWAVSLHDTAALWLGAALMLATPFVVIATAFALWRDARRLRGR